MKAEIRTEYVMPPDEIMNPVRRITKRIAEVQTGRPELVRLHIKEWQRYRGLTIAAAAAAIGVRTVSYRNWADNRHWPNSVFLPQIAEAFGCSLEELFFPPPGVKK